MTSLYIHIPFCQSKCYFCSFIIFVGGERHVHNYIGSIKQEAAYYKEMNVDTIYFGGGTPTYLNSVQLKELISIAKENFKISPECEFTIEANPENIDYDKAKLLFDLGVNRISLGVQSLNDGCLRLLGRRHDRHQAIEAFNDLRKAGFRNINLDLMHSLPGQGLEEIGKDVREITELGSEHLSLYSLMIEEKSKFFTKKIKLPDSCKQADQYIYVKKILERNGFNQYEVSSFAKPLKESRHNLNYWQGGNYIGLGTGAHSHMDGRRFWNISRLHTYMSMIKENKLPIAGEESLNTNERLLEELLFGLRISWGVNILELETKFGCKLQEQKRDTIKVFIQEGLLAEEDQRLKTTTKGMLLLDEICARLI